MATTIGRVDFIVGLDGSTLPSQARRFGERLARIMAAAANARLGNELGNLSDRDLGGLDRLANRAGAQFARRFGASFSSQFGPSMQRAIGSSGAIEDIGELVVITESAGRAASGAGRDYDGLRGELEATSAAAERNGGAFSRLRSSLSNFTSNMLSAREGSRGLRVEFNGIRRRAVSAFGDAGNSGRGLLGVITQLNDGWRGMAHGLRQAIFYVVLFMSLATQIAALGSAAGSGLTVLAGAAFQGAIGLGVLVAAFVGLSGELAGLPALVQPAAAAFQGLGDTFSKLGQDITVAAFAGLEGTFQRLDALIVTLTPSILLVADAVGRVVTQLVDMLNSTNGVAVLKGLIEGAAPVFELLSSAAFNLGGAIGNIFLVAQPYILQFSTWLNDILTQFNAWTQSVEGQNALQEWFENGKTIFEAMVPLLAQVGDFLNALVTPETVASLVTFMEIVGGSLAPLAAFLNALNSFGIFNIIAQVLSTVFQAIQPLMPALTMLGNLFQTVVLSVLQAVTPVLVMVATAIAELAEPIITALMPAVLLLLPVFQQLMTALMPVATLLVSLGAQLAEALVPVITLLVTTFAEWVTALMPLITAVLPPLISIIAFLIEAIMPLINAILPPLVDLFSEVFAAITPIIPVVVELISEIFKLIEPLLELIGPILGPLTDLLRHLVTAGVEFLKVGLSFLTPIIQGVATGIRDTLMPAITAAQKIIQGLGDFLTNVFAGNWEAAWESIWGVVTAIGEGVWEGVKGIINGAISVLNGLIGGVNNITGAVGIPKIPKIPKLARGAIVWDSTIANIGEAGPEMVVPLRRPLHMVDPQVRDVAAYAQGKLEPQSGPQVIIEEINVVEADDASETANEVVNRIFERAAG